MPPLKMRAGGGRNAPRGNELRAQTELNKAVAELQRATGNALEQNRVEIQLK